ARFVVPGVDAGRPGTDAVVLVRRGGAPPDGAPVLEDLGPRPGGGRWVLWRGAEDAVLHALLPRGRRLALAEGRGPVSLVLAVPPASGGPVVVSDARTGAVLRY